MPQDRNEALDRLNYKDVAPQLFKDDDIEIVEDVEIIWIESKDSIPCAEYGYFMTMKKDGVNVVIKSPKCIDALEIFMANHPERKIIVKKLTVSMKLSATEASILADDQYNFYLDDILIFAKRQIVYQEPRRKQMVVVREGLHDVMIFKEDPLESPHRCSARTRAGRPCKRQGKVKVGDEWFCAKHLPKTAETEVPDTPPPAKKK